MSCKVIDVKHLFGVSGFYFVGGYGGTDRFLFLLACEILDTFFDQGNQDCSERPKRAVASGYEPRDYAKYSGQLSQVSCLLV